MVEVREGRRERRAAGIKYCGLTPQWSGKHWRGPCGHPQYGCPHINAARLKWLLNGPLGCIGASNR